MDNMTGAEKAKEIRNSIFALLIAFIFLFPIYWLIQISFKSDAETAPQLFFLLILPSCPALFSYWFDLFCRLSFQLYAILSFLSTERSAFSPAFLPNKTTICKHLVFSVPNVSGCLTLQYPSHSFVQHSLLCGTLWLLRFLRQQENGRQHAEKSHKIDRLKTGMQPEYGA